MKKYIVIGVVLALSFSVWANPVPDFPFVIVTESLEKKVKPDMAQINFSILAYEKTSEKAIQSIKNTSVRIIDLLAKQDISSSSLKSSEINKTVKRARKGGVYGLEVLGYEMTQAFTLTLKTLKSYPNLMNGLIKLAGVQGANTLFQTTKREEYKEQMIRDLSQKARKKADLLAEAQLKKIKSVYGITTEENFAQGYARFSLEYDKKRYALAMKSGLSRGELIMVVPKYIKVAQRITSIYQLK